MAGCRRAEPQAAPPTASAAQAPSRSDPAVTAVAPSSSAAEVFARTEVPAPARPASAEPEPPRPSSVLIVGDSLSDEARSGGGFVRLLRERCPHVTFDNRAKGGFMVNQMRRRLEQQILPEAGHYSHAIVFGGVNDLYSDQTAHRTLSRIEADLSSIYAALKARNVEVIAVTVTPWGGFARWHTPERAQSTLALNRWILEQAAQGTVAAALDAYPLLSCGVPTQLCPELAAPFEDGLHFGKLGHQKLGEALYELAFRGCSAP